VTTAVGPVLRVRTDLDGADRLGALRVRLGFGRNDYRVPPGLYAVGDPGPSAPVLVSANYKLSFDALRSVLGGRDAFILVLDTKGVNVWCAAGKGTFGTAELVERLGAVGLDRLVEHRRLVVPQLGAPGVAAHEVERLTGFRVVYGPVRAADLPAFLDGDGAVPPSARRVRFDLADRLVLVPVEWTMGFRTAFAAALLLVVTGGCHRWGWSLERCLARGVPAGLLLLMLFLGGTALQAALLPWLPGRSFAARGAWLGLALAVGLATRHPAWWLLAPLVVSFVTLQFTGCSTFTSPSGVEAEMRTALPLQGLAAVVGLVVWMVL